MPVLRAEPKFELRTRAYVSGLIYDKASRKVQGVTYTDLRTGEELWHDFLPATAQATVETVLSEVRRFSEGVDQADDIALLALRSLGG